MHDTRAHEFALGTVNIYHGTPAVSVELWRSQSSNRAQRSSPVPATTSDESIELDLQWKCNFSWGKHHRGRQ